MKKKREEWIVVGLLFFLIVVAAIVTIFALKKRNKTAGVDSSTFSVCTDIELFQTIPIMHGKSIEFTEARDVGDNNYMIQAEGTTKQEYDEYLKLLEKKGYKKYLDNGADGMEGNVYSAYYQQGELTVYVCYFTQTATTMINVCDNAIFSENLFYDESYVADNIEGKATTLHSPELYATGNSFLFQLKNGHFILSDGGTANELLYLLDYMESLVPEGEKPIIEAWFITHSHGDHMGVLQALMKQPEQAERFYVESVFFNAPSKESYKAFQEYENVNMLVTYCKAAGQYLKTTEGKSPIVYRPRVGEKYYFNDITIDIIYSPELLEPARWKTWNASCFVQMYHIEGQKILMTADAEYRCQVVYMQLFDSEYFDIDVYQMPHHGHNVYIEFANYCKGLRTLIFPTFDIGQPGAFGADLAPENRYFINKAEEALTYGTGTKVLTFPYKTGECVTLPRQEWIYHEKLPAWISTEK